MNIFNFCKVRIIYDTFIFDLCFIIISKGVCPSIVFYKGEKTSLKTTITYWLMLSRLYFEPSTYWTSSTFAELELHMIHLPLVGAWSLFPKVIVFPSCFTKERKHLLSCVSNYHFLRTMVFSWNFEKIPTLVVSLSLGTHGVMGSSRLVSSLGMSHFFK